MTVVGEVALWVALFLAAVGSAVSFVGGATRRPELIASGSRAITSTALMTALASLGLWAGLLTHDFSLSYVATHTTTNTPTLYLLTAFWGGPAGAMLWWALALSACAAGAARGARRCNAEELPWIAGALAALLALTLLAVCFGTNPYDRVEWIPAEGRGLAPPLQTPLAAPHFVAIYGAYAAAAVLLTLVVGAMATRRFCADRLRALRFWLTLAWCLLTLGIALRMRWTYVEPAFGDFPPLEPAQVANLVLWLVGGALLRWFASHHARGALLARRLSTTGLYVLYAGVALVVLGAVAKRSWAGGTLTLGPGEARELADPFGQRWRFISQGPSRDERPNYLATGVALEAWRGAVRAGIVSAERRQYLDGAQRPTFEPSSRPGIRTSLPLDVYVSLMEVRGDIADLRVSFRPLVAAVWVGWALILAGGLLTALGMVDAPRPPGTEQPMTDP